MRKALLCAAAFICGCGDPTRGGSYALSFESDLYELVRDADCVSPSGVPMLTRPLARADCAAVAMDSGLEHLVDGFAYEANLPLRCEWNELSSILMEEPRLIFDYRSGTFEPNNDLGRIHEPGWTLRASMRAGAMFGDWLALTIQPELAFLETRIGESKPYDWAFLEASARIFLGKWEIMAGREPIWFGPGRHGALLISSNARPLKMVKFSNHEPVLLPGELSRLGPMRMTVFWTKLDPSPDPVGVPDFGGMRLEFRPTPRFAFGLSRTAVFGGEDRNVDFGYLWDLFWGLSSNEPDGTGDDQKAGFDVRYVTDLGGQPVELYVEAAGEDEAGGMPSKWATVMGLHLPRVGRADWARLTVEWATNTWKGQDVWYRHGRHGLYQYEGTWLGHHMGPDAEDVFFSIGLGPRRKWDMELWCDFERRNVLEGDPVARKDEWGTKLKLRSSRAEVALACAWQRFTDCLPGEEVVEGAHEDGSLFSLSFSWVF